MSALVFMNNSQANEYSLISTFTKAPEATFIVLKVRSQVLRAEVINLLSSSQVGREPILDREGGQPPFWVNCGFSTGPAS